MSWASLGSLHFHPSKLHGRIALSHLLLLEHLYFESWVLGLEAAAVLMPQSVNTDKTENN